MLTSWAAPGAKDERRSEFGGRSGRGVGGVGNPLRGLKCASAQASGLSNRGAPALASTPRRPSRASPKPGS